MAPCLLQRHGAWERGERGCQLHTAVSLCGLAVLCAHPLSSYLEVTFVDRDGERCPAVRVEAVRISAIREACGNAVRLAPAGREVQGISSAGHPSAAAPLARSLSLALALAA